MAEAWQARFGPSFYRFVYKDVLFVVLNSELFGMVSKPDTPVPGPWTQAEQLAFVERTLAEVPDPRWTIVIVHQPLWDYGSGVRGDWPKVEAHARGPTTTRCLRATSTSTSRRCARTATTSPSPPRGVAAACAETATGNSTMSPSSP